MQNEEREATQRMEGRPRSADEDVKAATEVDWLQAFLFYIFFSFSLHYFFIMILFNPTSSYLWLNKNPFSLSQEDDTKWPTRVDVSLNPNTTNLHIVHM